MKKLFLAMAVLALVCVGVMAQAAATTINFSAGDIVAYAPLTINTSGTPVVGDGYINFPTGKVKTFNDGVLPGNPVAFNAWLAGLAPGSGISEFNLWLQDGTTNQAAMWGENLSIVQTAAAWNSITTTAPTGWVATIVDAPWVDFAGHKLISYHATSADYYLRPGSEGTFSFTAQLQEEIDPSVDYQIWIGAGYPYAGDTNIAQTGGIVGGNGVYSFQRSVAANAEVPEPMSIMLGIMGLGSVAGFRKLRRK